MKRLYTTIFFIIALLASSIGHAQQTSVDSTAQEVPFHSPKKATIMSAVLPGLGQVYNKKYWKLPIIYGGLGVCAYFIHDNTQNYKKYRDALIAESDGDPNTENTTGLSAAQLEYNMDLYRRWLDISYLCLAGVYVLNIIDANVDAHLFHFDVGEEASLDVRPYFSPSAQTKGGLSMVIKF